MPACGSKTPTQLVGSQQVCACLAAGIHATAAVVDDSTSKVYLIRDVPFAKGEQALGMDTWSQPFHDTFIGMASLLHTHELSLPIKSRQGLYDLWLMQGALSLCCISLQGTILC